MKCKACGKTINKPEMDYIFLGLCRDCVDNWRDMIKKEQLYGVIIVIIVLNVIALVTVKGG